MNTFNAYTHTLRQGIIAFTATILFAINPVHAAGKAQQSFNSPEEAADALVVAVTKGDKNDLLGVLGKQGEKLINSGDAVADKLGREKFIAKYQEAHKIVNQDDTKAMLYIGEDEWPFLIPIVKQESSWKFDAQEGEQEFLNRRIGKNELDTIQAVLAFADAQREYYLEDRDGDGVLEYATKFRSSKGKKDGLYWPTKEGEQESPLGPLVAGARTEGYTVKKGEKTPYHGYYYKILNGQGEGASGGAYSYMAKGQMIGGFALIAFPARYGVSGVKSFLINHEGVVYETDMGPNTSRIAEKMTRFNPDSNTQMVDSVSTEAP